MKKIILVPILASLLLVSCSWQTGGSTTVNTTNTSGETAVAAKQEINTSYTQDQIANSQEYKDYIDAAKHLGDLTIEQQTQKIKPYYDKYKNVPDVGPDAAGVYGLVELNAWKFDEWKKILEDSLALFPDDKASNPTINKMLKSIDLWKNIDEYNAYKNAYNSLETGAVDAVPVIEKFHEKFKDNEYLDGETYYYLSLGYLYLKDAEKGKAIAAEGLAKFPTSQLLLSTKE